LPLVLSLFRAAISVVPFCRLDALPPARSVAGFDNPRQNVRQ
jgi:hypothetical protein